MPNVNLLGLYQLKLVQAFKRKAISFLCLFFLIYLGPNTFVNAQENYTWKSVAIGGGGFVSGIITSKTQSGLMYARTDVGGAYRWDAANSKWIPLLDWVSEDELGFLGVESIAIDPTASNVVYMLVGTSYFNNGRTAILKSTDNGNTFSTLDVTAQFKAHGNGMGRQNGERLMVDPVNGSILYCGTRANGIFKSTNAGSSWSRLSGLDVTTTPNGNGVCFVVANSSSASGGASQQIFAGISRTGSNFYRSNNGGQTFTTVTGGPTSLMPQRAVLSGDGNLYITYGNGAGPHGQESISEPFTTGQIWKYNISSGAWTNVTPSGVTHAFGGISVDPSNPNRLVASTTNAWTSQGSAWGDRFYITTNGGANWTDIISRGFSMDPNGITWINGKAIHWAGCIEFDPFNTQKVFVTSGNGLFVNENINATAGVWKFLVAGLEETVPLGLISIPNGGPVVSVIGDYDGFTHSNPAQYAPIHSPSMGTTTGLSYGGNKLLRVGSSMYYSTNQGSSWTQCSLNGSKGQVALSSDGNTFLHCPETSSTTYRSTNNGSSWSTVSGLSISDARPVGDPVNANKFYAYNPSNGSMLVSTNGGTSFSSSGSTSSGGSKVIGLAPGREGHVWIPLKNGGLSRSINSGQSFSLVSGVSTCGAIGFGKEVSGGSYPAIYIWGTVNGVRGIFRSTNEGSSWVRVNDDAHEYGGPGNGEFVRGDMNVYGRVYMSTAGRGIVYGETTTQCTPTAITPYVQVDANAWQQTATAVANAGATVILGPQPESGGTWSWTGPNNFSAATRQVVLSNIQSSQAGTYVARYTNASGCQSSQTFTITVNGASCTPTAITPYLQINTNAWQQTATATVSSGSTLRFGPHPVTGGSWSWTGPNNFSSTTREVTISNIQSSQAGSYVARYTNANGCQSTQTFTVNLSGGSIVVRARGTQGSETIELRVNNTTIGSWTLTNAYQNYTATGSSGTVTVHFTNDNSTRDVQVDYVTINGATYQSENQTTNTGVWTTTCGGSNSEWLNCNGYIEYRTAATTSRATTVAPREVILYPNPTNRGKFLVQFSEAPEDAVLKIFDIKGRLVYQKSIQSNGIIQVNSQLKAGLYMVRIESRLYSVTKKLTVQE